MKQRNGFVSNSSSSSFIVRRNQCQGDQWDRALAIAANPMSEAHKYAHDLDGIPWVSDWDFDVQDKCIMVSTGMDNYDMMGLFEEAGIPITDRMAD